MLLMGIKQRTMIAQGIFDKTWCRGSTAQQNTKLILFTYRSIMIYLYVRVSFKYLWINFESPNKTFQPYKNVGEPL